MTCDRLTKRQAAIVRLALRDQLLVKLRGLGNLSVCARQETGDTAARHLKAEDRKAIALAEAMRRLGFPVETDSSIKIWLEFRDKVMSWHA